MHLKFHIVIAITAGTLLALLQCCDLAYAEPEAGSTWEEPFTGMKFTWIPSGCFNMGSTSGNPNERPVHKVCLKGFYLGITAVTQAQYKKVTDENPSNNRGPDLPIESISWYDARDMAAKLSEKSGAKLRMPSEAEWEYACRAGSKHDLYCGDGPLNGLAWYLRNSEDETKAVGRKQPNAWGLYDMSGNVWEWTQDCWHESYQGAPTDGSAWVFVKKCRTRVARGGGWGSDAETVRAAVRNWDIPDNNFTDVGLRLVMVP